MTFSFVKGQEKDNEPYCSTELSAVALPRKIGGHRIRTGIERDCFRRKFESQSAQRWAFREPLVRPTLGRPKGQVKTTRRLFSRIRLGRRIRRGSKSVCQRTVKNASRLLAAFRSFNVA